MMSDRERRTRLRKNWPGGLQKTHTPAQLSTVAERLDSMWLLALDAWAVRGLALPSYSRDSMPGTLVRPK